jgi:hypothetical protein
MKEVDNILSIRTYQAVKFEGKLHTFFTTQDSAQRKGIEIEILAGIGVLLQSPTDAVIVPFPNISGIYLNTEIKQKIKEERKEDISKPAKAQLVSKIKVDPIGAKRL